MATKGSLEFMFLGLPYTRFRSATAYLVLKPLKEWDLSSLRPLPSIPVKDSPTAEAAEGVRPEQPTTPPLHPREGLTYCWSRWRSETWAAYDPSPPSPWRTHLLLKPLKEWDLSSLRPLPSIHVKDSPGAEATKGVRPEQPATPPLDPCEGLGSHGTESTAQDLDVSRGIVVQHILIAFITTSRWNNHSYLRITSWYNFLKTFWKTSVIFVGLVLDFRGICP